MPFPIVISFYTQDTLYQLEVQNLIASCERFGIRCEIEPISSFGSWEVNCAYKPFFIHRKLQELKQPVLWVDADGVFKRQPEELALFTSHDFAVRINSDVSIKHPSRVVSSTIYANYTPGADSLLRQWAKRCHAEINRVERQEEFWDQMALCDALYSQENSAIFTSLPITYTKIIDHPEDSKVAEDPVIEHYQASRRYKKLV